MILHNLILENMKDFLKELGPGYSFIYSEYKIKIADRYNHIDKHLKKINHDKTIGIIVCKKDNKYVINYISDKRILYREYILM